MKSFVILFILIATMISSGVFCADIPAKQKNDTDYKAIVQAINE